MHDQIIIVALTWYSSNAPEYTAALWRLCVLLHAAVLAAYAASVRSMPADGLLLKSFLFILLLFGSFGLGTCTFVYESVHIKTNYVALNFLCFYLVLIWIFSYANYLVFTDASHNTSTTPKSASQVTYMRCI
jgi:hypothetical protein